MRIPVVLVLGCLLLAVSSAPDFHWSDRLSSGQNLEIDNLNGPISVTHAGGQEVIVTATGFSKAQVVHAVCLSGHLRVRGGVFAPFLVFDPPSVQEVRETSFGLAPPTDSRSRLRERRTFERVSFVPNVGPRFAVLIDALHERCQTVLTEPLCGRQIANRGLLLGSDLDDFLPGPIRLGAGVTDGAQELCVPFSRAAMFSR